METNSNGSQYKMPAIIEVDYHCRECNATFKAVQGSRRYLCPECLAKAISSPRSQKGEA